jgi:ABC-type multidrug transport system fused ATPase/permease subunit/effector-binding domain-containing protein
MVSSETLALFFYPMLIDSLANGKNSLNRISSYLSLEENTPYVQMIRTTDKGGSISMKNGNFLWSSPHQSTDGIVRHAAAPALCHVGITVGPGEIVAVVGPVGSGKTALIKGLLGELSPVPRTVIDSSIGISADLSFADTTSIFEKTTVTSQGDIAYCSQEAWLPKGTLKEAIVFGRDYDEVRYFNAIKDAGLDDDFKGISNQGGVATPGSLTDNSDVGEGGSNLSGGQRARVALARALYADDETKVFLLDDPLAALDASVGATVFERLSKRLKSTNAAMVLVTNDPNIPRRCDRVILMGKYNSAGVSCSTVLDVGTYDELIFRGHDLQSLGSVEGSTEEITTTETDHRLLDPPTMDTSYKSINNYTEVSEIYFHGQNCTTLSHHADPDSVECMKGIENYIAEKTIPITPDIKIEDFPIIKSETSNIPSGNASFTGESKTIFSVDDMMSKGSVPLSTYVTYFKCIQKPILLVAMLLSYLLSNGAQFFQQFVVVKWTQLGNEDAMSAALGATYMSALVKAAGVVSLFLWLRSFLTMRIGINASEFLHEKMLRSVFEAPMSFFDATPSGQLLSRFGKEMETIDYAIPDGIGSVLFCFLQIAMSAAALAGVITPAMILPLSVIAVLYGNTMSRFRPAARDLKRSEASSRSPVYTHFGEALRGKEIIRSIKNSRSRWSSQHHEFNDKNLAVYSSVKALDRWLSIRLETLGNFVVFISTTISILLSRSGKLNAGSAGWGLTQSLAITGLLTWAVRTLTDLETHMMSMMRVQELTNLQSPNMKMNIMPKERGQPGDALYIDFKNPPHFSLAPKSDQNLVNSGWPWKGNIKFDRVSMRYNKISPLVLKNVSVAISAGTTLGIVGRTGSGKSSLLLALFRLVELESGGSITIDDVDVRSVSLQTLRRSVSIIPQDPVLFSGTLRYNLDATGKASTRNMWAAIEAASPELAALFRSTPAGLDTFISEGGKNLSSGQRQLICLARALLRGSKILVMDEATSSVDSQTDAKVQQTIRREFVNKGVTVLTVAHRLNTILGYDKIAVFGAGELVEYGSPKELLSKRNGEFRRLVEQDSKNKRDGMRQVQGVTSDIRLESSVNRLKAA